jgi:lipopolysaccharide export system permease protein
MRIINSYLIKEILLVAVATTGLLTVLLVLVNAFKDIFDLLLHNEVSLWIIFKLIFLLVPFVLTFTLPWGLLLAVLLVFGRVSQEKELTALKASGIGLLHVVAPAICLGVVFSALSFWINASVGPQCRKAFRQIGYELVTNNPMAFFTEQKTIDKFPGMRIWIGHKKGVILQDVHIWVLDERDNPVRSIRAESGTIRPDLQRQRLVLMLYNARQEEAGATPGDIKTVRPGSRALEMPLEISLSSFLEKGKKASISWLTLTELQDLLLHPIEIGSDNPTPLLTELQKRIALSVSCFTFVVVGVPLAIQTQRREKSIGVAISLAVVLAYYFITVLAEALKRNADVYPEVIIWMPNLIFQLVGFFLLWRANER